MENPYQAPKTIDMTGDDERTSNLNYYVVSKTKLFILLFATLGFYTIGWGYLHWKAIKQAKGLNIWPVPRAIFNVFFLHQFMRYAKADGDNHGKNPGYNYSGSATIAVIVLVANHVIDRLVSKNIGYPVLDVISLLMLIPMAFSLWNIQRSINEICEDPKGKGNGAIRGTNWIWIIIGLCLWVMVFIWLTSYGSDAA